MQIGVVIKKYRKDKNITQEEMAKRLGVTAPAVNKWENGHSLPDVALLSPIARLLNISVDTLLSHEKELSDIEANRLVYEAHVKLKKERIDDVFAWMKQCFVEYPNCYSLILWMTQIFDGHLSMNEAAGREQYDDYLLDCYKHVLESGDVALKNSAAESLYYFYWSQEQYKQAEKYLNYFSQDNPERKRKQAMIYSKTERRNEAYKMCEELLYAGYQNLNMTLHAIYIVALEENNIDKAHVMIEKIRELARVFEFGEYHEVSPGLELAALEKNEEETLHIIERMLTNLESILGYTQSALYSHMEFKAVDETYLKELREALIKGFLDEDTYSFLTNNQQWRNLVDKQSYI